MAAWCCCHPNLVEQRSSSGYLYKLLKDQEAEASNAVVEAVYGKVVNIPMVYLNLGIPLGQNMKKATAWRPIIDRFHKRALEHLHNREPPIVHADIKPGNIVLGRDFAPKVIDFGFSREMVGAIADVNYVIPPNERPPVTPGYAGPELAAEGKLHSPFDIYSLGIVMLEMMTGQ
ncbi:hypothetical protein Tsubulata_028261 [Turnera subulata]|uniref:Protein kinase domain-containing protein n=1 Tax=Turnera subulata TaxID=218843 RepID=A0A9Q0FBF1_9ROSI|nr:hypothetical protein Tsubulata_028261 [Turnera subulata]